MNDDERRAYYATKTERAERSLFYAIRILWAPFLGIVVALILLQSCGVIG